MKTQRKDYFPEIKKESELYVPLVNLFKVMYDTENIEITDKLREEKHGCDLILDINDLCKIGFQIKKTPFTKTTLDKHFRNGVGNAAIFEFGVGSIKHLSQFIWITTKNITWTIPKSDFEDITKNRRFNKEVEIWDGKFLYEKFLDNYPEAFTHIKIDALTSNAAKEAKNENHIFASHFLFRVFILCLIRSDMVKAREVIEKAISEVAKQKNKSIYFHRTLKRFYEIWQKVIEIDGFDELVGKYLSKDFIKEYEKLGDEYEKVWYECNFLMWLVNEEEVKKHIEETYKKDYLFEYNFLCDYQYIYSQLQILFHEYSNSPAGFSPKHICLILLRFGFPPIGKLKEQLAGMKKELEQENNCSVHDECSFCTATVLSCLVLANEDESKILAIRNWLGTLEDCRYSHRKRDASLSGADRDEHALHYAAQVLQAFVDCEDSVNSDKVLKHFFVSGNVGKDGFYKEWMRHRNITNLEVCTYIFSAFHRYFIHGKAGFQFDEKQLKFLKNSVENLEEVLRSESTPHSKPWRLYAARENIQSLCLGLLVGARETTSSLLREVVQKNHVRAYANRPVERFKNPLIKQKSLKDSNVDRTCRFIEGWVSYWETISYLVTEARETGAMGNKLKRTIEELKDEGFLPD